MKFIGILGGTFNPIHHGHLRIAQEIAEAVNLDHVKFIPSANPPHKAPPQVTAQQRAEMVHLAIQDNPLFSMDTRELARTGPSYTIDTLKSLRSEHRHATFCLILGADAFAYYDQWHEWESILNYCHLVLVPRPNTTNSLSLNPRLTAVLQQHGTQDILQLRQQQNGYIIQLTVTALEISSSKIRTMIAQHKSAIYLTPPAVMHYLQQNQLYQI